MPVRIPAFVLLASWLAAASAESISVGFGVAEITPPPGYPMSGYYHERGATGTLDPLQAKAVVFRQGDVSAALVVGDLIGVDGRLTKQVRQRIEAETGIPADHVVVAATHSHTGPDYHADLSKFLLRDPADPPGQADRESYIPRLIDGFVKAVTDAHAAAAPATLRVGAGREETVAFNRRALLKDGKVRTWAPHSDPDVVGPSGPTDPEVGLVTVTPADADRPTAAVVNFALHCDTVGGTQFSADYPGHLERALRQTLGPTFQTVFATGTCGNINHIDYAHGEAAKPSALIGERLAAATAEAVPGLTPLTPSLAVRRSVLAMPLQPYTDEDLAWADGVIARDRAAEPVPFLDEVRAYKIRLLHRVRTGRADAGDGAEVASTEGPRDTLSADVQAIRLGGTTALVALPGEVFVELGLAIKERSPFEHTFVIELANDNPIYVPTREAMEQGGYESTNSLYAPGGGERLVDEAVKLLNELK